MSRGNGGRRGRKGEDRRLTIGTGDRRRFAEGKVGPMDQLEVLCLTMIFKQGDQSRGIRGQAPDAQQVILEDARCGESITHKIGMMKHLTLER